MPIWTEFAFMVIEIYLTLNILFSILRGITNLYFSFFKQNEIGKKDEAVSGPLLLTFARAFDYDMGHG